jgi:hypothetical protein
METPHWPCMPSLDPKRPCLEAELSRGHCTASIVHLDDDVIFREGISLTIGSVCPMRLFICNNGSLIIRFIKEITIEFSFFQHGIR